jgi:hypothetical protein
VFVPPSQELIVPKLKPPSLRLVIDFDDVMEHLHGTSDLLGLQSAARAGAAKRALAQEDGSASPTATQLNCQIVSVFLFESVRLSYNKILFPD